MNSDFGPKKKTWSENRTRATLRQGARSSKTLTSWKRIYCLLCQEGMEEQQDAAGLCAQAALYMYVIGSYI